MANAFKDTTLVTKIMLKHFLNSLVLGKKVDRQVDNSGAFRSKVGETVYVERPVMFTSSDGAEITSGDITDIEEATVPVQLSLRKKVAFAISSKDKTLSVDRIKEKYIIPAAQELAQVVESAIADVYKYIYNFVGTPGTVPSTFLSIANAKRKLSDLGVPDDMMCNAFWSPNARVNLADGLKAVFPQTIAKTAIEQASFGRYGGFENFECQSLKNHTVGVATGTPLVNGASQNTTYALAKDTWTQSLVTDGWTDDKTGILKAGDVFTIANVYAVNRRTRETTGVLQDFVVTADADSGSSTGPSTLTISPPIITSGPYQTVDAAPADDAAITVKTGTGGTAYRQNMALHKNAITLAFAKIDTPDSDEGAKAYRMEYEGISIRCVYQYDISLDKTVYRFDVLFGAKAQNPGFGIRITE